VKRGELSAEQKKGLKGPALALAAACAIAGVWEGNRLDPYRPVPGDHMTVCRGETHVEMRHYTQAECDKMFEIRMTYFRDGVRRRNPRIVDYPLTWGAHASFAYNAGLGAYNGSSVARLFQQGAYAQSCRAMLKYKFSGGHVYQGLLNRRQGDKARLGEVELCLEGLKK
jgi:lysozyme